MTCIDCAECVRFKCLVLPQCPDDGTEFSIELGEVMQPDTTFNVFFVNNSNRVVQMVTGQSSGGGKLSVDIDALIPYLSENATYSVWATEQNAQIGDRVPFAYGPDQVTECATLQFEKVYRAGDGFPFNIQNQKLSI